MAAFNRYKLMMPVTSGYDSRVLLAASKDIKDEIFYYLNDIEAVRKSPDVGIAKKILSEQNLKLNLLEIPIRVDDKFEEVFFSNNLFANREMMATFYNYLQHFSDSLNLPGRTIPIIKSLFFLSNKKNIDGYALAKLYGYEKYQFAIDVYDNWLKNLDGVCERSDTSIFDLIYWEDKIVNSGNEIQLDKDIAQEKFVVFNSAYLISRMLTYDIEQRRKPYFQLHKDLINKLWPELLYYPFNPSFTNTIKRILIYIHLYKTVMTFKNFLFK